MRLILALIFLINSLELFSQSKPAELGFNLSYVLSALVYPNIISSDYGTRNSNFEIKSLFGFSVDLRYEVASGYVAGLSAEVVRKVSSEMVYYTYGQGVLRIPIEDNYRVLILEGTIYFIAPFSSSKWELYFGGGLGAYKGYFKRKVVYIESKVLRAPVNFGIHVVAGFKHNFGEKFLNGKFGIRGEIKFRDPLVDVDGKFEKSYLDYNGRKIQLNTSVFRRRINFDTMTVVLSFVFQI